MMGSSSERRFDSRTSAVRLQVQELMVAYSPLSENSSNRVVFAKDDQRTFARHVPVGGYGSDCENCGRRWPCPRIESLRDAGHYIR
ncbi:hypothetical protein [Nocardia lijiangensis]|uniref:hypothetical protein n=1 Tax=Nocardia lijiangensis TaxID=299618 RepID=UPI0008311369|nr:hypothetical protein [Nocardia lijiangensis]